MIKKIKKTWRRFLCRKTQTFSYIDPKGVNTYFLLYEVFVFGDTAVCRIIKDKKSGGKFVSTQTEFRRFSVDYALGILRQVKEVNKTRDCGFGGLPRF